MEGALERAVRWYVHHGYVGPRCAETIEGLHAA